MLLVPVFKKCTREELTEALNVEFPPAEWVSIALPYEVVRDEDPNIIEGEFNQNDKVEYETNRYDVRYRDDIVGVTISVYVYMDEDSSTIIAIDNVVKDCDEEDATYPILSTPFQDMLEYIYKK